MRRLTVLLAGCTLAVASCSSDGGDTATTATTVPSATTAADQASTTESPVTTSDDATSTTEPTDTTDTTEPAADTTEPTDDALPEIPLVGMGDYEVGVATITITDEERDRPLTVDVWFPLAEGTTGEPHQYTFVTGDYFESPDAITADASAISPDGPFPLVVYSHGSGGQRYIDSNYTETIASHGYIVAAPDHTGNTAVERVLGTPDPQPVTLLNRPEDIEVVINAMLDPESTETVGFVASADPERVAVTGHSLGGFTSYAVASGYSNDLGEVGPEPRLDAIIPIAPAVGGDDPATQLLSDERLEVIRVPALVIAGTNDQTTPIEPNVRRAWELTSSEPQYRLELVAAQHQTFTDLCAYVDEFGSRPEVNPLVLETVTELAVEGCSPGDMAIPRAQELTNTFAISFLDSIFKGGEMIEPDAYAIPDDVNFMAK